MDGCRLDAVFDEEGEIEGMTHVAVKPPDERTREDYESPEVGDGSSIAD